MLNKNGIKALRKNYELKPPSVKRGISLKLIVEIDKVLSISQLRRLTQIWSISTLQEFYEAKQYIPGLAKDSGIPITTLENTLQCVKKYLTKKEMKLLDVPGPKFPTGAIDPKDFKSK